MKGKGGSSSCSDEGLFHPVDNMEGAMFIDESPEEDMERLGGDGIMLNELVKKAQELRATSSPKQLEDKLGVIMNLD